jgi:hypothetical protein
MRAELAAIERATERVNEANAKRYAAIRAAHEAGHSLRTIATAAGLTPEGVRKVVARGQA